MHFKFNLQKSWKETLDKLQPPQLFLTHRLELQDSAWIALGKASSAFWRALEPYAASIGEGLVVSQEARPLARSLAQLELLKKTRWIKGEHPVPKAGSFSAGRALADFLGELSLRPEQRSLHIFLSGGGSSLLWLPPAGLKEAEVTRKAEALYRMPLAIRDLNRRRAQLCVFKSGGASRFMRALNLRLRPQVWVVSDVLPFGVEVVSSGPFFEPSVTTRLPHTVLADNQIAAGLLSQRLKGLGVAQVRVAPTLVEPIEGWVKRADRFFKASVHHANSRALIMGGEALISVARAKHSARGGRLSHLSALLLAKYGDAIANGRISIAALSTDGRDGASGGAGVILSAHCASPADPKRACLPRSSRGLDRAIQQFDTGRWFFREKCLVPEEPSGTNVQDLVVLVTH